MPDKNLTYEQLLGRLSDLEWEDFEVKEARSAIPKNVWETVSAFSNTAGGWLIFGVRKIGKKYEILGVDNVEKMEQDFTTTLRGDKFNVKIIPECRKYEKGLSAKAADSFGRLNNLQRSACLWQGRFHPETAAGLQGGLSRNTRD